MDQQLKFSVLAQVLGTDKVVELRGALGGLGSSALKINSTLANAANGTYLFTKAKQAASIAMEKFRSVIDYGDELEALSERTGISAQALSGYKGAADQSNLSFEELEKTLKKFSQGLGDVNNEKFRDALVRLGVEGIDPVTGKMKASEVLIDELADKFSKMEDGPRKAYFAMELFGKSGDKMIPFLNQGSEALRKFRIEFSDAFTANADTFNDNMSVIEKKFKQIFVDMADGALPTLLAMQEEAKKLFKRDQGGDSSLGKELAQDVAKVASYMYEAYTAAKGFFEIIRASVSTMGVLISQIDKYSTAQLRVQGVKDRFAESSASNDEFMSLMKNGDYGTIWKRIAGESSLGSKFLGGEKARQPGDLSDELSKIWKRVDDKLVDGMLKSDNFSERMAKIANGEGVKNTEKAKKTNLAPSPVNDRYDKEGASLAKFAIAQAESLRLDRMKLESYALSAAEMKKLSIAEQMRAQALKDTSGWESENKNAYIATAEAIIVQKQALVDLEEQQKRSFIVGARVALRDYLERLRDVASQTREMFSSAFQNMEDSLVNFVKTGKLEFTQFANAIIDDLIRIAVRQATLGVLVSAGFAVAGGASSSSGSAAQAGSGSYLGASTAFANGGIMTARGSVPLRTYAKGGVANSPQLALFGEGRMAEAYVPLPDGRSIPVTMKGGNSAGGISIVVHVNTSSGEEKVAGPSEGQALGKAVSAAVKQEILNQMRPGGLLS